MGRGPAAGEFWVGQGGERRGRPPAVCSARTNAVQAGKTRRPEGLVGKGPLAALLGGHRPLRVCFLLAPCQSNPSLPNRTPPHFQTGSYSLSLLSDRRLGPAERRPRYPVKNLRSVRQNATRDIPSRTHGPSRAPRSTRDIPLKNTRKLRWTSLHRQTHPADSERQRDRAGGSLGGEHPDRLARSAKDSLPKPPQRPQARSRGAPPEMFRSRTHAPLNAPP